MTPVFILLFYKWRHVAYALVVFLILGNIATSIAIVYHYDLQFYPLAANANDFWNKVCGEFDHCDCFYVTVTMTVSVPLQLTLCSTTQSRGTAVPRIWSASASPTSSTYTFVFLSLSLNFLRCHCF